MTRLKRLVLTVATLGSMTAGVFLAKENGLILSDLSLWLIITAAGGLVAIALYETLH